MSVFVNRISIFQFALKYRLTSVSNPDVVVMVPSDLFPMVSGGSIQSSDDFTDYDPAI